MRRGKTRTLEGMGPISPSRCALCTTVAKICFWGPRAEKKWKRPVLFVASLLAVALGAVVFAPNSPNHVGLYALFGFVLAIGILGVVVSIWGCGACVARVFGDAF